MIITSESLDFRPCAIQSPVRYRELPKGTLVRLTTTGNDVIDLALHGPFGARYPVHGVAVTVLAAPWRFISPNNVLMNVSTLGGKPLDQACLYDFISTRIESMFPGVAMLLTESYSSYLCKVATVSVWNAAELYSIS